MSPYILRKEYIRMFKRNIYSKINYFSLKINMIRNRNKKPIKIIITLHTNAVMRFLL
jgi:hypothetical protein